MVRQKAILDLALQFENACTAKDDLRKAYEKCNDISQESRALIAIFLKEGSDKDYELNISMYRKAAKIEKQMNAKLLWLREKYNYRSQTHIGGSPSQTHEEFGIDIDDSDLHLTLVLRSCNSIHVEPSPLTPNPIRIIPGPAGIFQLSSSTRVKPSLATTNPIRIIPDHAGIVQQAKLLKEKVFILDSDRALMSTQEYMQKVVEDVGEDEDFKSGAWVSATNYVNANGCTVSGYLGDINNFPKNEKLEQVVGIVKSCSPNVIGDLTVTIKDLSGTIPGTIHYKVIGEGGYGNDITVGAALILANVSVFTPKPSIHYLNITKRNVVKVFRKDTIPGSGSAEEHDIGDEYLTEGYLTENEQQQLALDEEALRETLEEEAKAKKERTRAEKEWEKEMEKEQAHDELFQVGFWGEI
ncbi:transposase, MuDR, MULE transposase domain protein [Tanacetum coccineum]